MLGSKLSVGPPGEIIFPDFSNATSECDNLLAEWGGHEFEVQSLGDMGVLVSRQTKREDGQVDTTLFFDCDGVVLDSEGSKRNLTPKLHDLFSTLYPSLGLTIAQVEWVQNGITDPVARVPLNNSRLYSPRAHSASMVYALERLHGDSYATLDDRLEELDLRMSCIAQGAYYDESPLLNNKEDGFRWSYEEGERYETVFDTVFTSFRNVPIFPGMFNDIVYMRAQPQIHIAALTYGDPELQLAKLLDVFSDRKELFPDDVILATAPKGDVLAKLVQDQERWREIFAHGRVVVVDDRPRELDSIGRAAVQGRLGRYVSVPELVHVKRPGYMDSSPEYTSTQVELRESKESSLDVLKPLVGL